MLLPLRVQHLQKTALSGHSLRQQSRTDADTLSNLRSKEAQIVMCSKKITQLKQGEEGFLATNTE